jgi:YD repeat-containing protein
MFSKLGTSYLWDSGSYTYDWSGNIFAIDDDLYEYDRTSRLVYASIEDEGSRSYQYDPFGNLTRIGSRSVGVDPSTNRIDEMGYDYDDRGNLEDSDDFGHLTYDALNMPLSRALLDGSEAWFAYTADEERIWTGQLDSSGVAQPQKLSLRGVDNKVRRELLRDPSSRYNRKSCSVRN